MKPDFSKRCKKLKTGEKIVSPDCVDRPVCLKCTYYYGHKSLYENDCDLYQRNPSNWLRVPLTNPKPGD